MIRKLTVTNQSAEEFRRNREKRDNDPATTIVRLVLRVTEIWTVEWVETRIVSFSFGGYGFSGTMGFFTGVMHIPALFAPQHLLSTVREEDKVDAVLPKGLVCGGGNLFGFPGSPPTNIHKSALPGGCRMAADPSGEGQIS